MKVTSYHSHLYYDESTFELAMSVLDKARELEYITIGHPHQKKVGPHPRWSCQLLYDAQFLNRMVPWLFENRKGLTVFTHANTGDDYLDHTQNTLWMGEILELKLDIFKR